MNTGEIDNPIRVAHTDKGTIVSVAAIPTTDTPQRREATAMVRWEVVRSLKKLAIQEPTRSPTSRQVVITLR